MSKVKVSIWGREFELGVSYQNYPGEEITENQRSTLAAIPSVDYDAAKIGVEGYIRKFFSAELGDERLDNLFRFVMPKSVLITRADGTHIFAIMCNFKLDMEHGIAVIYEDERLKAVGPQDLIL